MKGLFFIVLVGVAFGVYAQSGWLHDFEFGLSVAQKSGKLALVDFWATWCGPCKRMDAEVWNTAEAATLKERFVPIKIDVDIERNVAMKYGVRSIPMVVVMDYTGKVIHSSTGYSGRESLVKLLASIPNDVSAYYERLAQLESKATSAELRDVGLALQLISNRTTAGQLRNSLLAQSDIYLKKAKKSADDSNMEIELTLWQSLNDAYRNRAGKAIKEILELSSSDLSPRNVALSYWVLSECYKAEGDTGNQTKYLDLFRQHPASVDLKLAE
ncbi:MAG: thioredoxin family protein [Cyclobacteriaceae bacterium]|jgi:thioredoxin-like negative regulator of GroEL